MTYLVEAARFDHAYRVIVLEQDETGCRSVHNIAEGDNIPLCIAALLEAEGPHYLLGAWALNGKEEIEPDALSLAEVLEAVCQDCRNESPYYCGAINH